MGAHGLELLCFPLMPGIAGMGAVPGAADESSVLGVMALLSSCLEVVFVFWGRGVAMC